MDKTEIESQIEQTMERFAAAWNTHDVTAMAACWTQDGNAINPLGRYAMGRAGVTVLLAAEHGNPMKESIYRIISATTNVLSPDTAVLEALCAIDGVLGPNGRRYTLSHMLNAVLRLDSGAWQFVTLHPTLMKPQTLSATPEPHS